MCTNSSRRSVCPFVDALTADVTDSSSYLTTRTHAVTAVVIVISMHHLIHASVVINRADYYNHFTTDSQCDGQLLLSPSSTVTKFSTECCVGNDYFRLPHTTNCFKSSIDIHLYV